MEADEDQTPSALAAHDGDRRLHDPHRAPEIRLELLPGLRNGGLFGGAGQAPAGAGHHRPQAAVPRHDLCDAGSDRLVVVDVHDQRRPAPRRRATATGADHDPTLPVQLIGPWPVRSRPRHR